MQFEITMTLLTAALGAAATWIARQIAITLRDRRVRELFPVNGRYISEYEDEVDGAVSIVKDTVVIAQRGTKVDGTSTNLGDGRVFELHGEIIGNQYLSGVYHDQSPKRGGLGTFFMQPDEEIDGGYRGIWAGWGATQKNVVGGGYRWIPATSCSVRRLSSDDLHLLPRALAILGEGLGERYVSQHELAAAFEGESSAAVFGAFASNADLLGVGTVNPLTEDTAHRVAEAVEREGGRVPAVDFHRVGVLQSSAVVTNSRGRGVGMELLRARMNYLEDSGYTMTVALSWDSGAAQSSRGLLEAAGFELRAELPEFWRNDSQSRGYACPKCGNHCRCTALLFTRVT